MLAYFDPEDMNRLNYHKHYTLVTALQIIILIPLCYGFYIYPFSKPRLFLFYMNHWKWQSEEGSGQVTQDNIFWRRRRWWRWQIFLLICGGILELIVVYDKGLWGLVDKGRKHRLSCYYTDIDRAGRLSCRIKKKALNRIN